MKQSRVALWVVGLAVYGLVLLAALLGLERLFIAERDDAKAELSAQRRALETYAERSLKQLLRERLDLADPEFDRAVKDPYLDDSALRYGVDGAVLLPRVDRGPKLFPQQVDAESFYQRLKAGNFALEQETDEPVASRLEVLRRLVEASERCDERPLAAATEQLLNEEAAYQLPIAVAGPVRLLAIESLARCEAVNPELLRRLVRDGMPARSGQELEGLQGLLLRKRSGLFASELSFLCLRTRMLSRQLGVDDTDFAARCSSHTSPEPWPEEAWSEGETLAPGWYYRTRGAVIRGLRTDAPALLRAIHAEMVERGLLRADDGLDLPLSGPVVLDEVRLALSSGFFDELGKRADRRLAAKTGLLVAFAGLAVALAAAAVVSQRRKHRYLELKSDFVAAVSHELRTPLASLRVMAETLERRLEGEVRAKDYPRRIVAEADALSGLVENILSFNRLDKGRWVAHPRPVALAEFQKSLEEEARAYGLAQVELTFEGFEQERLDADPELLKLLFSNLLRNACRYNANDPVRVRFSAARDSGGLSIRAFDNGVGIPPGEQEAVFEEFKRLKGQAGRGGPGSGLGLSLCRRIMGLHGGTLTLEASSASGSTFLMRFPHHA